MASVQSGSSERQPHHPLEAARFKVAFEYYWAQLANGMADITPPEELQTMHDAAFLKEIAFYDKVSTGISQAQATAPGRVVCLFDVDGTIAEMKDIIETSEDDTGAAAPIHMLLRPAFTEVVAELATAYPEVVRFGLLSLRPADSLQAETDNPTFLSPARPFIDDSLIYSSGQVARRDPLLANSVAPEIVTQFLESMRGIIESTVLEATQSGDLDLYAWYDPKLKIAADLHRADPDTTYVLVDNLPFANHFDPDNNRLLGICVEAEQQLLLPLF